MQCCMFVVQSEQAGEHFFSDKAVMKPSFVTVNCFCRGTFEHDVSNENEQRERKKEVHDRPTRTFKSASYQKLQNLHTSQI